MVISYLLISFDQFLRMNFCQTLPNSEKALPSKVYHFVKKEKPELQTAQTAGALTKHYLTMTQVTTALQ
jgi:hypothetical protein